MPQIKKDFSAGKMNKDLDERIVPNGQYRDAMNIQVRTTSSSDGSNSSGGSNAGTVRNIPGTSEITSTSGFPHYEHAWDVLHGDLEGYSARSSAFIGSVANEKDNKAYFFLASPNPDSFISFP